MDNFMDKLSGRFSAVEVMQANAAAEERERERAKKQTEEYEHMMQELRRLHLKNAEMTEQVQQLIQTGIERFEEFRLERQDMSPDETGSKESLSGEAAVRLAEQAAAAGEETKNEIIRAKMEVLAEVGQSQTHMRETIGQAVRETIVPLTQLQAKTGESIRQSLQEVVDPLERTQAQLRQEIAQSTTETLEHTTQTKEELAASITALGEELEACLRTQSELAAGIDALKEELSGRQTEKVLADSIDELRRELTECLIGQPQPEEKAADAGQQPLEQLKASIDAMHPLLTQLQEHVHKENVKVYRNVQAVITDVAALKARELGDRIDALEKKSGGVKNVMSMAVMAMIFSLLGLFMQLLIRFGVF